MNFNKKQEDLWVLNFQTFCFRILKEDGEQALGINFPLNIIDDQDRWIILKKYFKNNSAYLNKLTSTQSIQIIRKYKSIKFLENSDYLLNSKNIKLSIEEKSFIFYQKYLKENNLIDYDDLLIYAYKILLQEKYRKKWKQHFDFIFVDDFQDIQDLEYKILKLIYKSESKILVMYDANKTNLSSNFNSKNNYSLQFIEDFKCVQTIFFKKNYRSTNAILKLAQSCLDIDFFIDKQKNNFNSPKPVFFQAETIMSEVLFIAQEIKELINKKVVQGFDEIIVTYRNPALLNDLMNVLTEFGIPFYVPIKNNFFQSQEIKYFIWLMKILVFKDDFSFINFLSSLSYVENETIKELENLAKDNGVSLLKFFSTCDFNNLKTIETSIGEAYKNYFNSIWLNFEYTDEPVWFFEDIINDFGIIEHYSQNSDKSFFKNAKQFLKMFKNYWLHNKKLDNYELYISFLNQIYLNKLIDENVLSVNFNNKLGYIKLMPIDKVIEYESKIIFFAGLNNEIIPSNNYFFTKNIIRERELFFSGLMRSRNRIYLSSNIEKHGNNNNSFPICFLSEIPLTLYKTIYKTTNFYSSFHVGDYINSKEFGIGKIIFINPNSMKVNINGNVITVPIVKINFDKLMN